MQPPGKIFIERQQPAACFLLFRLGYQPLNVDSFNCIFRNTIQSSASALEVVIAPISQSHQLYPVAARAANPPTNDEFNDFTLSILHLYLHDSRP